MLNDIIQQYGSTIVPVVTWGCPLGMLLWFIKERLIFKIEVDKEPFGDYPQPKTAQTLGVLGTFIGIATGLLTFNTGIDSMHDSVINLLSGMKTAFITSIMGMGFYLYFSWYQNSKKETSELEKENVSQDASIADLIQYMMEVDDQRRTDNQAMVEALQKNNQVLGETISNAISEMQRSVVGDGEYTVIGQMKQIRLETRDEITKLREETRRGNEELIKEFREFAKNMAENNTKAFIEALNETMKDFNTKLTEQFGENFKQLNEAVGRLLDWQIKYKETVEEVTKTQREIFNGIEGVRESMKHMENSSAAMTENANNMADLIVTANTFNEKLKQALTDLKSIAVEAQNAIPQIVSLVDTSTNEIANYTKDSIANIEETTQKTNDAILNVTTESIEEVSNRHKDVVENINSSVEEINTYTKNSVETMQKTTATAVNVIADSIHITEENMNALTNKGIEEANRYYDSWGEILKSAYSDLQDLYESIANELDELANKLKNNSELITDNSNAAVDDLKKQTENTIRSMEEVSSSLREASNKAREDFEAQANATHDSVRKAADSLQRSALNVTKDIADQLEQMMKTNNESLKKSSENLSRDLDNKITNSLESMGNAMGSISQKFANDYRPIADRLAEIVELANPKAGNYRRR